MLLYLPSKFKFITAMKMYNTLVLYNMLSAKMFVQFFNT